MEHLILALVAVIIALAAILCNEWQKNRKRRERLDMAVRESANSLHKAFDLLREGVGEQIRMVEKAKTKRQLTEEEERVAEQLRRDLDYAEQFVRKGIEDIKREAK